ncbi:MAG: hypothetical protein WCG10_05310 [Chlamydiota bacterium]
MGHTPNKKNKIYFFTVFTDINSISNHLVSKKLFFYSTENIKDFITIAATNALKDGVCRAGDQIIESL